MPTPAPSRRLTFSAGVETVVLAACVFWAFSANRLFLSAALPHHGDVPTAAFALALVVMLVALNYLLVAPFAYRVTVKPLLTLLLFGTALATYYMRNFGVVLDTSMMGNVWHTDVAEARELWSWALALHLLVYAALPAVLLWRVRVVRRPWLTSAMFKLAGLLIAVVAFVVALLPVFKPFASMMRSHREVRYLAAPVNFLWAGGSAVLKQARGASAARRPLGSDAAPGPRWAARTRPRFVVLVVGETARAANWQLDGYERPTTPELAALPVITFGDVTSCGTDTETSLPCMFAPGGRRNYDEKRIRHSESLLHVLARAGVRVHWRDNQSGCKGVCDGLPQDEVASLNLPGLCSEGRCLDEGLLAGLDQRIEAARAARGQPAPTTLLVLHQLGSHGPSYFRRYPPAFAHLEPACIEDDLQKCTREQIVNAYDNSLRYTDHVLASIVATLQAHARDVDSALVYVSDHGESLGENNLYLHGLPRFIAPREQTHVPMLMWLSAGLVHDDALDLACLRRRAAEPASHDHLFHTLLGLVDVQTGLYEPAWDLAAPCRRTP
ncbi:phosphoethanolamine transferase [Piscinibacter koreensis]|uniref:Phosphoethanolamine--lipid A transferase n=1 Tax=Piscinibacter koreensis TaxID=2742824 RepID=A0A7Y6NP13_9BURK|nr:phosphoethanolamine--lipid A transferase [Schlegelella koreensis]NUZ06607.1 phosphoethanolamine--lipid A transferase [Schlegelella koreensis]